MSAPVGRDTPARKAGASSRKVESLARRPAPTAPSTAGGGGTLYLPVLEASSMSNNIEASATPTWAVDNTYPHCGYLQMNALNAHVAWPIDLGPKGSIWHPIALLATGTDFGKVEFMLGTPDAEDDGSGLGGTFESHDTTATFASFPTGTTVDCYSASPSTLPGFSETWTSFQIGGDDGAIGTAFSAGSGAATYVWNGGAGPHWVRLKVTDKNASSSGYRMRLSALMLIRMGNDVLV